MSLITSRKEVLLKCNEIKNQAEDIITSNTHVLINKMAQQLLRRAESIEAICGIDKFNLYFSGNIAIGKSTLICTLLNLINRDVSTKIKHKSNLLLLKVGSGRTTLCETHIHPNAEKTLIKIEKVESEDFIFTLKEYCKYLYEKENSISKEETRVIANMANIPIKIKEAWKEIEHFELDKGILLETILEERIAYSKRTITEIKLNENESFEKWLQTTFINVNDGKIDKCPMPRKIHIYIAEKDFKLDIPEYIDTVIDTRGLDGGERLDIQNYICNKNSITIMCDRVNEIAANEGINSILKQVIIKEEKDIRHRVALVGLEREDELSNITDYEDDRQSGIEMKTEEAIDKMKRIGVDFETANVFFVDSMSWSGTQDNEPDINYSKLDDVRYKFFESLEKLLLQMYTTYYSETINSVKTLNLLKIGAMTDDMLKKFADCKRGAMDIKKMVSYKYTELESIIRTEIESINHSSLWGAVNHNGEGRTADVYASLKKCAGESFYNNCNSRKEQLFILIKHLFTCCSDIERVCYLSIIEEMDILYLKYYNSMRDIVYNVTKCEINDPRSWIQPQSYWGDGLGRYTHRVCNDILNEMESKGVTIILQNLKLEKDFFDEVISFLSLK